MTPTIGIIAPLIDREQFNADFNLRLGINKKELTLAALYELASEGFRVDRISRGIDHEEDMPAAGYYIEGLLRQQGFDTVLTNRFDTASLEVVAKHDPFAVCVSATMIVTADSLVELLAAIRKVMPDTFIIAGGMLIWKNYLLYRKHRDNPDINPLHPWMLFHPDHAGLEADVLVAAPHGRSSLLEVLAILGKDRGASLQHIPNLALPRNGGFEFTARVEESVDYNEDFTRWDLIGSTPAKIPIRTSIGCPYRCRFCDFCQLMPSIFIRSRESLERELALARARLGHEPAIIHVTDDNVFINRQRLREVCTAIARSGLNHWIGFMRARDFSAEEMALLEHSGLMMGMIGAESGDQGQLDRMNKRQKVENLKKGVEQLDAHGISTLMTFVVGFPGENRQTLANTAGFLNDLSLSKALASYQLYPLLIEPLSGLDEPSFRAEWKLEGSMEKWSHFTMNSMEAAEASYELFREVTNLPYHYSEESNFFNRSMFSLETRKALYSIRHRLTVMLMENAPWDRITANLAEMARLMEMPDSNIPSSLKQEILIPAHG